MSKNGFFAYPSAPEDCGEVIEEAIAQINQKNPSLNLKSWKQLQIAGNLIISKILKEIEASDFFCADITGLNENVLFELGFAIGKRKPIFIIQDTTISDSHNKFKEFIPLTSIGYKNYTSSAQIIDAFFVESPHNSESILLDQLIVGIESSANKHALLYLKGQIDSNYNQYILESINSLKLPVVIDDATEDKIQSLTWYLSHILTVPAVLVEFSQIFRSGHEIQNAKCALIAGLALGLDLKLQMVAAKPFPTTLDYQEYLKKFTNIETCKEAIFPFLTELKSDIAELIVQSKKIISSVRSESILQKIKFGESIAEHESNVLYEYYVNTAHDENIIKTEYNIVVGRKGSGKTATLYFLQSSLGKDVRNQTVTIKPVNFEIDGLIELLKKLNSEFEKGFIIQSIWKFLIYTEVAKHIYKIIKDKAVYALESLDVEILNFVEKNNQIILTDFSTRLEQELINLQIITNINEQTEFRQKISEILHEEIIGKLKELIISYMNKKNKLVIIIDNLDKNWRKDGNLEITSKFILGLLGVIGRIVKELKGNPKKPNNFDINLIVLLRSDIFKHVLLFAREPDKIEYTRLRWNDPEVLFRLIDSRIEYLSDTGIYAVNFWEHYVPQRIRNLSTKKFILSSILPRPRDLIFFLNSAKNRAVSRGHTKIIEKDFISAHEDYSSWVFQSILVENGITIKQMENFPYNCIGENSTLTKIQIINSMAKAEIPSDEKNVEYFIDFLCSISFLGREVRPNEFEYEYDFETDVKIKILAEKLNSERFKIHNAFIPFLECSDYISSMD